MSADPDYYELLQVPYDADSKEIISTYRLLARQYHPDLAKDSSATKRMLALNKAIEVLGDPKKRREYDARRLQARAREALAREAAEAGADDKAGRSRAPARKRAPDPRHTRAVTTHRPGPARKPTKPIAQPPAPKSRPVALVLGLGAAAFGLLTAVVVAVAVGLGGESQEAAFTQPTSSNETTPVSTAPASSASPRPTESPFLPGSDVFESRGIWFVGADMAPGVWRAVRAVNCTWKRLSARDPTDEAVVGSGSSLTVELHPSDVAFWSEGCGWWTQILTPPSASPTEPFGPGTWLVGQEVAPGSWQNSNSSAQCSWARLKTLDGGSLAAISSGTTGADGLVIEIGTDDVAFHSWGCGTWTRGDNLTTPRASATV